jgi:hypothetical protein
MKSIYVRRDMWIWLRRQAFLKGLRAETTLEYNDTYLILSHRTSYPIPHSHLISAIPEHHILMLESTGIRVRHHCWQSAILLPFKCACISTLKYIFHISITSDVSIHNIDRHCGTDPKLEYPLRQLMQPTDIGCDPSSPPKSPLHFYTTNPSTKIATQVVFEPHHRDQYYAASACLPVCAPKYIKVHTSS